MDFNEVERLLAFMEKHGLEEFEYERDGLRVRLKKPSAAGTSRGSNISGSEPAAPASEPCTPALLACSVAGDAQLLPSAGAAAAEDFISSSRRSSARSIRAESGIGSIRQGRRAGGVRAGRFASSKP